MIIASGGPDIGIRGGLDEWYIAVYEDYKAGRSPSLRPLIGWPS